MSNLLRDAIIDAKALRETALRTAESSIIEKYSDEVRKTLSKILEQEEAPAMGAPAAAPATVDPMAAPDPMSQDPMASVNDDILPDVPLAALDDAAEEDGENLSSIADGESFEINLDLPSLEEAVKAFAEELDEQEIDLDELNLDLGSIAEEEEAKKKKKNWGEYGQITKDTPEREARRAAGAAGFGQGGEGTLEEDEEIELTEDDSTSDTPDEEADVDYTAGVTPQKGDPAGGEAAAQTADSIAMGKLGESDVDSLADAIMEKLTVDMGADLAGWAGRTSEDVIYETEKELAHRRSTDVEEELLSLRTAYEELVFENKQLNSEANEYKQALYEVKDNLEDVNLSNARLLYTNRVLRNTSLNERQKTKIVEAISTAGSVTEARMMYKTLESTVESVSNSGPKSLSEAIARPTSVIRATRHETAQTDPFSERMKKLAGINS